jgi:hypothetical protein
MISSKTERFKTTVYAKHLSNKLGILLNTIHFDFSNLLLLNWCQNQSTVITFETSRDILNNLRIVLYAIRELSLIKYLNIDLNIVRYFIMKFVKNTV